MGDETGMGCDCKDMAQADESVHGITWQISPLGRIAQKHTQADRSSWADTDPQICADRRSASRRCALADSAGQIDLPRWADRQIRMRRLYQIRMRAGRSRPN